MGRSCSHGSRTPLYEAHPDERCEVRGVKVRAEQPGAREDLLDRRKVARGRSSICLKTMW